ncbi:MAG: EamA family transporter [Promethearchaeota archaeon]
MLSIFSISFRQHSSRYPKRSAKMVAISGFFGMGLASLIYIASIKLIGATIRAKLESTSPLFTLPFSVFYLKEEIT